MHRAETLVQQLERIRKAIPKLYPDDGSLILSAEQRVALGLEWNRNEARRLRARTHPDE